MEKINNADTVVAKFTASEAQMGADGVAVMSASGFDAKTYDSGGNEVVIVNLGYGLGTAESGTANAPYYTLGKRSGASSVYNPNTTYTYGDKCKYDDGQGLKEYVCYATSTTGAWDATE